MLGIGDFRWLLSAVFVFLGSAVFYFATLVSGHNIYRDLQPQVSILVTGITGFLLFVFSPLAYIVLFPSLYIDNLPLATVLTTPDKEVLRFLARQIHAILIEDRVLLSYVLAAVGVGIVFGCSQFIRPRELFFDRLRNNLDIGFSVYSYHFAWDDFLRSVRKGGEMRVQIGDKDIKGNLWSFSVKGEPRQIMLKNVIHGEQKDSLNSSGDCATQCDNGGSGRERSKDTEKSSRILVANSDAIKTITVMDTSFKPDYVSSTPSSYAFYITIMLMGLMLVITSAALTAEFTFVRGFGYLSRLYLLLGVILLLAYSLISFRAMPIVLAREFSCFRSAMLLRPFFFYSFSFHCAGFIAASGLYWMLCYSCVQKLELFASIDARESCIRGIVPSGLAEFGVPEWSVTLALAGILVFLICGGSLIASLDSRLKSMIDQMVIATCSTACSYEMCRYESLVDLRRSFLVKLEQEQDSNHRAPRYFELAIERLLRTQDNDFKKLVELWRKNVGELTSSRAALGVLVQDQFEIANRVRFLVSLEIDRLGRGRSS